MKIDFSRKIPNLDGTTPPENPQLCEISVQSLVTLSDADRQTTGQQKLELAELAQKIHKAAVVELPVEDVALIKKRIGQLHAPIIVKGAWDLLEGPSPD